MKPHFFRTRDGWFCRLRLLVQDGVREEIGSHGKTLWIAWQKARLGFVTRWINR